MPLTPLASVNTFSTAEADSDSVTGGSFSDTETETSNESGHESFALTRSGDEPAGLSDRGLEAEVVDGR